MVLYRCYLCVSFLAVSLQLLLNHLRRNHKDDPNFHVLCGIDGCARTYTRFISFRNHIIRKHSFHDHVQQRDEEQIIDINNCNDVHDPEDRDIPQLYPQRNAEQIRQENALCLLGFKDKGRVPQTVIDLFVESSTHLVRNHMELVEAELKKRLDAVGTNTEDIPGLKEIFGEDSFVMNPFNGIEDEPKQYRFYKDNFHLVEPRKIILGRYHVKVRKGNKLREIEKTDDAYYIPLLESLQQLLNDESILEEIENPHSRDDNLLSDFCDGECFKEHPLFGSDPHALQLLLYFDEVEVCNPLGSRANKHKLAALYYTLGNIKPRNRSHMNAIQLLGLVTSKHLKIYGIEPILTALMDDLCQLEQDGGYQFLINNEPRIFHGTIAYISGDNLGSQFIGGFKQGSQAHRKCRVCMAHGAEIQTQFNEDSFVLRTKESYNIQCQRLIQGEHFKKTYGLNKCSILNNSRYYHVIGGLPADAMHDILEGVLQYTIKEILKVYVIEKKFFTLEALNNRITTFDYGYHNDTNKPAEIQRKRLLSSDNSLKQHANQMWCLALYLPLLVGEFIPEEDEHWELLCTLLQIIRIAFSPSISKNQVPYLQMLIQDHHEKFKELFPHCSVIPKMHYMIHMPRTILQLGPLVASWCMRYEAKHHYFKRLAVLIGNFVNLPFSLAKRHQETICYRLQSQEGSMSSFIEKGIQIGPGRNCYVGDVDFDDLVKAENADATPQTPIYEARWVSIHGVKYKVGVTLHIGHTGDELPKFWEVNKIFVINKCIRDIIFIVTAKQTVAFSEHFQCYEIASTANPTIQVSYFNNFSCILPLSQCKPFGVRTQSKFICLRYDLDPNST